MRVYHLLSLWLFVAILPFVAQVKAGEDYLVFTNTNGNKAWFKKAIESMLDVRTFLMNAAKEGKHFKIFTPDELHQLMMLHQPKKGVTYNSEQWKSYRIGLLRKTTMGLKESKNPQAFDLRMKNLDELIDQTKGAQSDLAKRKVIRFRLDNHAHSDQFFWTHNPHSDPGPLHLQGPPDFFFVEIPGRYKKFHTYTGPEVELTTLSPREADQSLDPSQ